MQALGSHARHRKNESAQALRVGCREEQNNNLAYSEIVSMIETISCLLYAVWCGGYSLVVVASSATRR